MNLFFNLVDFLSVIFKSLVSVWINVCISYFHNFLPLFPTGFICHPLTHQFAFQLLSETLNLMCSLRIQIIPFDYYVINFRLKTFLFNYLTIHVLLLSLFRHIEKETHFQFQNLSDMLQTNRHQNDSDNYKQFH